MRARCVQANHKSFHSYGGRGISVCARWLRGDGVRGGYECFRGDMGRRPSPSHSIDRVDVEGNYSPDNCRWSTVKEQNSNKRSSRRVADERLSV